MQSNNKFVIIIQANEQDVGKAVHGLLYGQELHETGYEVEIVFDGLGTEWPERFGQSEHPFHPLFKQVMKAGIVKGGCEACAGFFEQHEDLVKSGIPLVGKETANGHLPFAEYIRNGYQPIIM
ncbi:hypothetical protein [Paenibacillus sp. 1P07SE]|uniref:hypothetical protein n=1 Tax=Paenibacillus sp. 1P07SE TaxID=3132209 RepID=UPI0039A4310B